MKTPIWFFNTIPILVQRVSTKTLDLFEIGDRARAYIERENRP